MPVPARTVAPFAYCGHPVTVCLDSGVAVPGIVVAQVLDGHGRVQALRVAHEGRPSVYALRERIVTDVARWEQQAPGAGRSPRSSRPGDGLAGADVAAGVDAFPAPVRLQASSPNGEAA